MTGLSHLPWGLLIQSTTLTPADVRTSAAGDPFEALVIEPVKYQHHIIIPKGATLHGRLMEVKQEYQPRVSACLRIEFHTVEFAGKSFRISLASRAVLSHPTFGVGHETIPFDKVHPPSDPRGEHIAGICFFDTDRLRLDSHTVNHWRIW